MNADKRLGFNTDYETVAASQTDQAIGASGAKGDLLERLVVSVATAATSAVSIKDGGGSAISIVPANTPVGVYSVNIGAKSFVGAWSVTTGAGVSVVAVGRFS